MGGTRAGTRCDLPEIYFAPYPARVGHSNFADLDDSPLMLLLRKSRVLNGTRSSTW